MHPPKNDRTTCKLATTDSEAARLVALCADQIGAAVKEASCEIDSLSCAVLDSARQAGALLAAINIGSPKTATTSDEFELVSRALQESARTASTRLQFADRLEQRLLNVSRNLAGLARLMRSIDLPITEVEWVACLAATRATFTIEQERQMFDAAFDTPAAEVHTGAAQSPEPVLFDAEVDYES